ncbi:MAG: hypothetical protein IIA45_16185 [Bacteroidetes bacterium]|nr:hypothetical protein [Bacteroidota bacterium]
MLAGALAFWMRGWRALVFIVIILSVNYMMKFELFNHKNKAFGLNYSVDKVAYNHLKLEELSTISIIENDKISYFETLNNWKAKFPGDKKPKMIFINVSGGGLRSTVWTLKVLQKADSMLKGELLNHTTLITGASGGMIGAAYYRELYLRKLNGDSIDLNSMEYLNNVSRDLLNSILFTAVVNDLFFPIQKYRIGDYSYTIDRGYSFEMQLNENTDYILDKSIGSYVEDEKLMRIPSMIMNPVITNDARYLFISSLPVSFLTRPFYKYGVQSHSNIDGVEFTRLLVNHDPYNLKFTSALRMNASFPYITPNAVLPTWPELEIVDAGIRNNYGVETAVRFLFVFREWIAKNTDGVVFLQIRDLPKRLATENKKRETVLDKIMNPIGDAYVNLQAFQDFSNESLTESVEIWFDGSFDIIELHYVTSNTERRAALSWHLTSREKESIIGAIDQPSNISNLNKLKRLILD